MDAAIVGIGIHPFGRHAAMSGRDMAIHAVHQALADAGIQWRDAQFAFGASIDGGQPDTLVSELGLTGLQFVNVANGCASGGSALAMAEIAIRSGAYDLGVVVGFDKHPPGAFNADPEEHGIGRWYGETGMMMTTQFFALKIQRYLHDYGIERRLLAQVAEKAFRNGEMNPNAWRRRALSVDEIEQSLMISDPLTQYMFCSPGEGAVAFVVCRGDKARTYSDRPTFLRAVSHVTRKFGSFEVFSPRLSPERGSSPSADGARRVFELAGIGPKDIDIAQIQDTESGAEIMHMAETGLCEHGEQGKMIDAGATEIGGSMPINTDGGCLANGEPIGASGLRQVYENVLQLRGDAGERQVPGEPRTGFTHVYGAPGISACTILTR